MNRARLRLFAGSRWPGLAALFCALAAGLWLYLFPRHGALPLLLALLPQVGLAATGDYKIRPGLLEAWPGLFLLASLGAVWAAYDRSAAWDRFWMIAGAFLLYTALARGARPNLWIAGGFLAFLGCLAAVFALAISRAVQTEVAALLMVLGLPFALAWGRRGWGEQRIGMMLVSAFGALIMAWGLVAVREWAAVLGVALAFLAWGAWAGIGFVARSFRRERWFVVVLAFLLLAAFLLVLFLFSPGGAGALLFKALLKAFDHLQLMVNGSTLIGDFLFTGGGLASFAGLYSRYVLLIPVLFTLHGHNLFLDVAVEQGFPGLVFLLAALGSSFWLLLRISQPGDNERILRWAVGSGLAAVMIFSLAEDPFYPRLGLLFLFCLPGFAAALAKPDLSIAAQGIEKPAADGRRHFGRGMLAFGIAAAAVAAGALLFNKPLASAWYAYRGAVEMARVELKGWPESRWEDCCPPGSLSISEGYFERALQNDPHSRLAHARLGLIALRREDYAAAITHLEEAYRRQTNERGVRKALGYSYAWGGRPREALGLLRTIPEAQEEMGIYAWWWGTQGRQDLALLANEMMLLLDKEYLNHEET